MAQKIVTATVMTDIREGYSTTPGGDNLAVGGAGPQPGYNNSVYMTFPTFGIPAGSVISSASLWFDMIGWDYKAQCWHRVQACDWAGTPTSHAPVSGGYNDTEVPYNTYVDNFAASNAAKQMFSSGKYFLKQFVVTPADNRKTFSATPAKLTLNYTAPTAPTAPTGLSSSKSSSTAALHLSWSKGSDGTLNAITGQELRYQTSNNGSTWSSETVVALSSSSTSYDISDATVDGWGLPRYVRFRVGSKSNYASTVYSGYSSSYRIPEPPTAPTGLSSNKSSDTAVLRLAWAKGFDGASNPITGQYLRYQTSSNGSTWSSETLISISSSATYYDISDATVDGWGFPKYVRFRVGSRSDYSPTVYSGYSSSYRIPEPPSAPSGLLISKSSDTSVLRMSWTKGVNGASNAITDQTLRYQTSNDGSTWSSEVVVPKTVSSTYHDISDATVDGWGLPKYVRFRVCSTSNYSSDVWSGYSSAYKIPAQSPTSATSLSMAPNTFYNSLTFSWVKGSGPAVNPITGQEIRYQTSDDGVIWNSETVVDASSSATSYSVPSAIVESWNFGERVRFRIGTKSEHSATVYSSYSLAIRKNRAPNAPIGTPTTNTFIYSPGEIITVSFTPPVQEIRIAVYLEILPVTK